MAKKNDENLKDKIKSLFRLNKDKGSPVQYQRAPVKEFVFTAEILKDIGPESPSNNRLKTIKELSEVVLKKKLEENAVEAVWCSIQDLVLPQALSEKRHVALQFLQCLLEGQLNSLGILRGHFFHVLEGLTLPENTTERLALFKILSENGRNLLEFEEEAGPALLEWMPLVITQDKTADFLPLLISAIKYNAAYMDEEIISGFVKQTCFICNQRSENDIKLCLEVLDVVVCYSYLPSDCLQDFVEALCRLVNIPKYSEPSWELMRKLLGTHLGHSSIYTMCVMLQDRKESLDFQALRGAIFYIGMALWGSRKVPLLKHTHAAVLPSFLHVLSSGNSMLAYEVILSVQRLVKKYGKELNQSTWDIVLDIVENVLKLLDAHSTSQAAQIISADPRAMAELHDTLTPIETLHETGQFSGSVARFFKIIEMCAAKRPEESVILLISHQAQSIHPGKENWINNLYQLMDKYFRNDARTKVRLKALDVLAFVLSINKHMYEDELINSVVLPHLCHIDTDADVNVRKTAVEILLVLAQNCSQACFMDVIGIVEKVLSRPAIGKQMSPYPSPDGTDIVRTMDESHLADLRTAAAMLVDLFKNKLYTYPAGVCIKLYDQLITHLTAHYAMPRDYSSNTAAVIRKCKNPIARGPYRSYDPQDLTEAYRMVMEEGLPVERVAKMFNVPVTTLKDRAKGRIDIDTTRSGPKTVFTQEQEAVLARHLTVMGEVGFGYSRQETVNLASDFAFHLGTRDKEHPLGFDWFYGFLSRWPELKVVKPRSLEAARAKSATESAIKNYFKELEKIVIKYNLADRPQYIYNIDEKGLSAEHKPPKIVAGKKYKLQAVTSGKSQNVTMIGCVNAAGQQVPPFFIFPGKRMLDSLLDGASPGTNGTVTESGWSNSDTFIRYMKEHLLHYLPTRSDESPVLVLYDGHKSHVTIPLIEWAAQENIVLFVLPPHCSHILQPLDVSCYGPLELAWNSACHKHLRESGGKIVTRYDVCRIACRVYTSTLSATNIQAAFQKAGVYPFNPSAISPLSYAPSTAFPSQSAQEVIPEQPVSGAAFLEHKGGQIMKNVQTAKIRKTLSKVVGGKAITEPEVIEAVKSHFEAQKKPKQTAPPAKKARVSVEEPVPGPSGLQMNPTLNEDACVSDTDSDITDTETCVVCKLFYPKQKTHYPSLKIVTWGCCDSCNGWVHLSYCTPVKVLRRGDSFLCPMCRNDHQ